MSVIRCERKDGAAIITVDRPERRNALNTAMRERIVQLCSELAEDRSLRLVVLRASGGKVFVSGADISEFSQLTAEDLGQMETAAERMYAAIERLPVPTIAVIEGRCIGGGVLLAACCDLRVCTTDATFAIPSARSLGNSLGERDFARMASLIGPARLRELIILAGRVRADTALSWGLVNQVVEPQAIDEHVEGLISRLSGHAPLTMWAVKEAMRRWSVGEPIGRDIMQRVHGSRDFQEGVAAFLEKRPPVWKNE